MQKHVKVVDMLYYKSYGLMSLHFINLDLTFHSEIMVFNIYIKSVS